MNIVSKVEVQLRVLKNICENYHIIYNRLSTAQRHSYRNAIRNQVKDTINSIFVEAWFGKEGWFEKEGNSGKRAINLNISNDNDPTIHNTLHAAILDLQEQGAFPDIKLKAMITKGGGIIADVSNLSFKARMVYNATIKAGKQLIENK